LLPVGDANTKPAFWLANVPVKVPVPVTGEFVTVNKDGRDKPTDDTVPAPALGVCHTGAPATTVSTCPLPPVAGTFAST